MKNEESVGCVMIYEHIADQQQKDKQKTRRKEDLFLLVQSRRGDWNFVKGHREYGESDEETLRREVYEETGIKRFRILGFVGKIKYRFLNRAYQDISKEVRFYLALSDTKHVRLSPEHISFRWVPYQEAVETITFSQSLSILNTAVKMRKDLSSYEDNLPI